MTCLPVHIIEAAASIRRGEIVAFPTETYYGLAVDGLDGAALERLFALKGREGEKTSALLVADLAMFAELCAEVPARARELVAAHWPGPLTLALPARADLPVRIVRDGFVAARVSSHPVAHALVVAASHHRNQRESLGQKSRANHHGGSRALRPEGTSFPRRWSDTGRTTEHARAPAWE